jgi:1-aminocyclopropane-1-carboxylate deaminase/D-cysteine desulfhydrase-like pyridoxal-dependent ACC family enzyme
VVANLWRIRRLARGAARILEDHDGQSRTPHSALRIDVVDGLGAGYGYPSPAGERARAVAADHGLVLDPTYGAKAFAFLVQRGTGNMKRVVFWHTFAWP